MLLQDGYHALFVGRNVLTQHWSVCHQIEPYSRMMMDFSIIVILIWDGMNQLVGLLICNLLCIIEPGVAVHHLMRRIDLEVTW